MSKLLTMLMAGAFALTLGGFAAAQNQPADAAAGGATNTPPAMSEEGSAGKPAATPDAKSAATPAETPDAKAAAKPAETPDAKTAATPAAKAAVDPAAGGATLSKGEQEYLVALKKCEALTGTDKSTCIDAAKKKLGEM